MLSISQLPPRIFRAPDAAQGQRAQPEKPGAVGQAEDARGTQPTTPGTGETRDTKNADGASSSKPGGQLSKEDQEQVRKLAARDMEVRAHEQAHASTGGAYAGAPSFELQRGPDGQSYAVGGEVPIDVSPIPGDPQATILKMQQVKRAALAPAEPSGADRAIAAHADSAMLAARSDLMTEQDPASATDKNQRGELAAGIFDAQQRRSAGVSAYGNDRVSESAVGLSQIA